MQTIELSEARRLALARAGLLKPAWAGFPGRAAGSGRQARAAAHRVLQQFGYLQLDTVSITGARSHALVLLSRLAGFDPALAENLLRPGEPLFEYWGHEASWLPLELYPVFAFRRAEFRQHPWWGDLIGEYPRIADNLRWRIRAEGPLRSLDFEGRGSRGWWDLKIAKKVAAALWSCGELAIRERRNFQRIYDLTEHVVPACWRESDIDEPAALERLLLLALQGHGWASTGTLGRTWRLSNRKLAIAAALDHLVEQDAIVPCTLANGNRPRSGWIRPCDLDLAARLKSVRPRADRGVLLSPFDPLLWDRERVQQLFGFDQILEIFKPAARRVHGYYCLPVLAGERLIARVDMKADRPAGLLRVLSLRFEGSGTGQPTTTTEGEAARTALARYARALDLRVIGARPETGESCYTGNV